MKNELIEDILGWDSVSWSPCIHHWNQILPHNCRKMTGLELGAGFYGGCSLFMANKGISVDCSSYHPDYIGAPDSAKKIHSKYNVGQCINYIEKNALAIHENEKYDLIMFKSMLGGIVRDNDLSIIKEVIQQIHTSLKPGGKLIFAENLYATSIHHFFRKKYGSGNRNWRYFKSNELLPLLKQFDTIDCKTFGFLGCFGKNTITSRSWVYQIMFSTRLSSQIHDISSLV